MARATKQFFEDFRKELMALPDINQELTDSDFQSSESSKGMADDNDDVSEEHSNINFEVRSSDKMGKFTYRSYSDIWATFNTFDLYSLPAIEKIDQFVNGRYFSYGDISAEAYACSVKMTEYSYFLNEYKDCSDMLFITGREDKEEELRNKINDILSKYNKIFEFVEILRDSYTKNGKSYVLTQYPAALDFARICEDKLIELRKKRFLQGDNKKVTFESLRVLLGNKHSEDSSSQKYDNCLESDIYLSMLDTKIIKEEKFPALRKMHFFTIKNCLVYVHFVYEVLRYNKLIFDELAWDKFDKIYFDELIVRFNRQREFYLQSDTFQKLKNELFADYLPDDCDVTPSKVASLKQNVIERYQSNPVLRMFRTNRDTDKFLTSIINARTKLADLEAYFAYNDIINKITEYETKCSAKSGNSPTDGVNIEMKESVKKGPGRASKQLLCENVTKEQLISVVRIAYDAYKSDVDNRFEIEGSKIECKEFILALAHVLVRRDLIVADFPVTTYVKYIKEALPEAGILSHQAYSPEFSKVKSFGKPFYMLEETAVTQKQAGINVVEYKRLKKICDIIFTYL